MMFDLCALMALNSLSLAEDPEVPQVSPQPAVHLII